MLNDAIIRDALIRRLQAQSVKPKAIMEELHVCNGRAIADVVALYSEAHCYEIKGDGDKIERILTQGNFYNSAFRKITLVTTEKHLEKALRLAPSYWGLMTASYVNEKTRIRYHKKALPNPHFDPRTAVLTLWKSEMLTILDGQHKRKPRDFLADLISQTRKVGDLSNVICDCLIERHISPRITHESFSFST